MLTKSFTADNRTNDALPGNRFYDSTAFYSNFTFTLVNNNLNMEILHQLLALMASLTISGYMSHLPISFQLFRKLFNSYKPPANWKHSNTTPLFKNGDPPDYSNRTPLTLSFYCM